MAHVFSRQIFVCLAAVVSLGVAGYVIADLNTYMSETGVVGAVPDAWPLPPESGVKPSVGGWTFVLTAHPKCPCTRATVDQLLQALRGAGEDDRLIVLVRTTPGPPTQELDLGVLEPLRRLSNADFISDPDATLSDSFGGKTSGFLVAFDPDGTTAFAGGLTPRRGIVGPAAGVESIRTLITNERPAATRTDVFGCPLCNDGTGNRPLEE